MSIATILLIAVGAAIGAPVRFVAERRLLGSWPRGTLLVNAAGSLLLGLLVGYAIAQPAQPTSLLALVGTGFCGALTTFGGFAAQTLDLIAIPSAVPTLAARILGPLRRGLAYSLGSLTLCLLLAWIGFTATSR